MNIATYSYDNGNRVDTRTYNNGVVADYTYDANNRITSLTHDLGATLIAGFTHQYDNEGNKLYEEQQHNPTRSEAYAYDSIYRLVDYKVGTLVAGTVPVPTTQTAYNLDEVGNWDSKTTDAVTENRTHNAANEITAIDATGISHDDNGNLIQDASYDYTFDENNRLVLVEQASVPVASYSYDALGRRISKVVGAATTVFLYDNARIIEERDGSNNVQATYTYGNYIDEVLTKDAGANRYYYHQNTLWSVHALTDASGAVVERYTYDAYGAITVMDPFFVPLSSSPLAYFTYTGREFDGETALYHYRARTYGAALGRFYSRDPLGYVDGMNLYEYVRGRVVRNVDPYGTSCVLGTIYPNSISVEVSIHKVGTAANIDKTLNDFIVALGLFEAFQGWFDVFGATYKGSESITDAIEAANEYAEGQGYSVDTTNIATLAFDVFQKAWKTHGLNLSTRITYEKCVETCWGWGENEWKELQTEWKTATESAGLGGTIEYVTFQEAMSDLPRAAKKHIKEFKDENNVPGN